ncbi:hypothetical protein HW932_19095 [Allochromatium humboldtianum]|uniref:Uncharacterized protein n=1 Tax=Allochromatium humboldtianum TaxID=504901 RepID=A0A850RKF5_9GAMM|nr:hypothetical protein [Allochromatium humboldtianum]NVZ11360.1 hypothetical protein [Allochromatium humboldtianum]
MIRQRIERLEQRTQAAPDVLILVGEPDIEQRAMLAEGKVRVLIHLPPNGRGHSDDKKTHH